MNQPTDQLAQRLRELPLDEPRPERITSRVLGATARPKPSRVLPRLAIAAAILVAALPVAWGVLYLSPATAAALADASGPGGFSSEILDNVGLGTGSAVTAQSSSAMSSGYKVKLVGVYADSIRTVILLKVQPGAMVSGFPRLTDQFGMSYEMRSAEGNLETGDEAMTFEPPPGFVSVTGLRFTLEVQELVTMSPRSVHGAWTVKGVVLLNDVKHLAAPASGHLGQGSVTFIDARYGGRVVSIRADVRGISLDGEVPAVSPATKPTPRFDIKLLRADGSLLRPLVSGWASSGGVTKLEATWVNVEPGTYKLVLTLAGEGQLQSPLVVG
jgi:hypothetical protein